MKKTTFILTLTAAICSLTSCENKLNASTQLNASNVENISMAAVDVITQNTAEAATAPHEKDNASYEDIASDRSVSKELSVSDIIKDKDTLSSDDYKEARQRTLEETEQFKGDTAEEKSFKKGVSNGNTYTSEFAGFRIVAPEDAEFLDEDNLYTEYMMPTRFMYEEEKDYYLTAVKDASVSYGDPYGSISVWFYNIKERYPKTRDMSAEDFIQREFRNDHGRGDLDDIYGPDAVNICGKLYLKISSVDSANPYAYYVRKINDTYIVAINATGGAVDDMDSRFEAVS